MFCEKGVLCNFAKFAGKHVCQRFFFNEVAGLRPTWWLLQVGIIVLIIGSETFTCILFSIIFLNTFIHHGESLSSNVITFFGTQFKKINIWLKIITCFCTLLFEKRKFQFTTLVPFLTFNDQCSYHIETICLYGFYMMETLVVKGLMTLFDFLKFQTRHWWGGRCRFRWYRHL